MPRTRRTPQAAGEGGSSGKQNGSGAPLPAAGSGGSHVLIVHRRAADRRRLVASFAARGFRTTAVASAAAARKAVQQQAAAGAHPPFELAVVERDLPNRDALKADLVRAGVSVIEVDASGGGTPVGNA
jgi:hypothetical protein